VSLPSSGLPSGLMRFWSERTSRLGPSPADTSEHQGVRWFALAFTALTLHTIWLVVRLPAVYTHEDLEILGLAARDLAHGRLHQIDFPGQFYGSSLEAFPAAPLVGLGMAPRLAIVVSLAAMFVVQWGALGWAVLRRVGPWHGVAVVLVPLIVATRYTASALLWATAAPRFLATIAVAVAFSVGDRRWRWVLVVGLSSVALLFDYSTALIVGPVLVWMFDQDRAELPVRWIGASVVPAGILFVGRALHHAANPAYDLHPSPSSSFSANVIRWHVEHPTAALRTYGPELLVDDRAQAIGAFLVVAAAVLVGVVRAERGGRAAAAVVMAGLVAFFASEGSIRAWTATSEIVSIGRGLMGLPVAVVVITAVSRVARARINTPAAAMGVAVIATLSLVVRVGFDSVGDYEAALGQDQALSVWQVDDLNVVCNAADQQGIVGPYLASASTLAYGCSSILDHPVLFPAYERRTWLLRAHWEDAPASWLVMTPPGGECEQVPAPCRKVGAGVALIEASGSGIRSAAVDANLPVRPLPDDWPS